MSPEYHATAFMVVEERGIVSLLFVDECGYTGPDLLTLEQPVLSNNQIQI
jgi:capsule polysaccharide modification protein KpsS